MIRKIIYNFNLLLFYINYFFNDSFNNWNKTNKFNRLISDKIEQDKNINLELKTINFKLDPKRTEFVFETKKPKINYKEYFYTSK